MSNEIPSRLKRWFRRKPLPGIFINIYLMIKWRCLIHPAARIQYPTKCRFAKGTRIGRCRLIARGQGRFAIDMGLVHLHDGVILDALDGHIKIGHGTVINPYCVLYGTGGLVIGRQCGIAAHTVIVAASHNFSIPDIPIMQQGSNSQGIQIEDNVWIGAGCRILDGSRIQEGTVLGAGSVLTRTFPPGSILGGVPAKLLKMRPGFTAGNHETSQTNAS